MAYPTVSAPYGFQAINRVDGMPYSGATTTYLIDPAGLANNIFYGSVVQMAASGYIELADGTGADITTNNFGGSSIGAMGVFVGCDYINTQGQLRVWYMLTLFLIRWLYFRPSLTVRACRLLLGPLRSSQRHNMQPLRAIH
jgi:hypothetical protein